MGPLGRAARGLLVGGLLLPLAACGDPVAIRYLDRSFALVAVDGRPVPRAVEAVLPCWITVGAGTLDLSADGRFSMEVGRYQECDETLGIPVISYRIRYGYDGSHTVRGEELTLTVRPVHEPPYTLTNLYSGDSIVVQLSSRMRLEVGAVTLTFRAMD